MSSPQTRVPAEGRRQQILDVATELFARQGYNGTTTRQVALRAAVNEAITFRHFPTKEELYWAVIERQCSPKPGRLSMEERLGSNDDPAEILTAIAEDIITRDTTLSRLLLFTALEKHELSDRFYRTHVARYYDLLCEFVRKGIDSGRFRHDVDPLLAARALMGMLVYHFQVQELYGGKRYHQFDAHDVSGTLVKIWLDGMRAGALLTDAAGPSMDLDHKTYSTD